MPNRNRARKNIKSAENRLQENTSVHVFRIREVKVVTVAEEQSPFHNLTFDCPERIFDLWTKVIAKATRYEPDKEQIFSFALDTRYKLKSFCLVSMGTLNEAIAHPREIFRPAIVDSAHSIIIAHNHCSGNSSPSRQDCYLTRRIYEAGELLQIPLLDHIIVGDRGYFSFRERGWPPRNPRAELTEFGKIVRRDMLARARAKAGTKRNTETSKKTGAAV